MRKANLIGSLLFLGIIIAALAWAWENTGLKDLVKDSVNAWVNFVKGGLQEWQQLASGEYYEESDVYVPPPTNNTTNVTKSYIPDPILDFHCDGPIVFYITNNNGKWEFLPDELTQSKIMRIYITPNPELKLENITISSYGGADSYFNIKIEKDDRGYYVNVSIKKDVNAPSEEEDFVLKFKVVMNKTFKEIIPILLKNSKSDLFKNMHLQGVTYIMGDNFYVKPEKFEYDVDNTTKKTIDIKFVASQDQDNFNVNITDYRIPSNSLGISITRKDNNLLELIVPSGAINYYAILPINISGILEYINDNVEDPTTCYITIEEK